MNRREILETSAMGLLLGRLGELSAAASQAEQDASDKYRYGRPLTGSEMLLVEETKKGVGAMPPGGTELPDASVFMIPLFFDQAAGKFIHSKEFKADLDPKGNYRMKVNVKSIHLQRRVAQQIEGSTLQVRTVASAGNPREEDWISWLVFTAVELAFKKPGSSKGADSGLVALGASGPLAGLKKDEQPMVKNGQIQACFELFGERRQSWLFKLLKNLSSATAGSPILAQVAFPKLVEVARHFIMQTVQEMEKRDKTTPILTSYQGSYGVAKGTKEIYKLGSGLWALVSLPDLQEMQFLRNHTMDFEEMQFALKTSAGSRVEANYMVVDLDFVPEKA